MAHHSGCKSNAKFLVNPDVQHAQVRWKEGGVQFELVGGPPRSYCRNRAHIAPGGVRASLREERLMSPKLGFAAIGT